MIAIGLLPADCIIIVAGNSQTTVIEQGMGVS